MKKQFKYIVFGLAALSVSSCADLDTLPMSNAITTDQKQDAIAARPDLGVAGVNAISASYNVLSAITDDHFDFGYAAIMLGLDHQTADLFGGDSGYNWFRGWQGYYSPTPNGTPTAMAWYTMYKTIKVENDVLTSIDPETTEPEYLFYMAQALANRAFNYWVLANLYQFNYQQNPEALCVPIITELNAEDAVVNGAPRATVAQVYDQIISDLNRAITALEVAKVDPASVIASKPKRMVSLATAYGLRARAYLSMGKYTEAALDAQAAISNFKGRPYTKQEVSRPGFTNLDDPSWMWGIAVAETDNVVRTGIVNFPSHMCSFAYGYVTVGGWRWIGEDLYDAIPASDVRKGWFLDGNFTSPNLSAEQQAYLDGYIGQYTYEAAEAIYIYPYTNVKYDSYQGVLNQSTNASDIPLMRVEEMYYILAEAQAMSGDVNAGTKTLVNFVKANRDSKFAVASDLTAEELQEIIFQQRRVELWGEGLIWFDYMRLNKGVDRRNAKSPSSMRYVIEPNDPVLIYCIPTGETTANPQLTSDDNNPSAPKPSPVIG